MFGLEDELIEAKDQAYKERNALVCALSKLWPSHFGIHEGPADWDPQWRNVICIHAPAPAGQLTWHIHDRELPAFSHLLTVERVNDWDGHSTEEKYARLARLTKSW